MRERNLTVGGLLGYDSSKVSRSLNVPSSKGVSPGNEQWHNVSHHTRAQTVEDEPGPKITAFHSMMLSGSGLPEIPPGGSDESLLKSRMRRFLQFVDYRSQLAMHAFMILTNVNLTISLKIRAC